MNEFMTRDELQSQRKDRQTTHVLHLINSQNSVHSTTGTGKVHTRSGIRSKPPNMATSPPTDSPIQAVQLSALVVMRIIKHSTTTFPQPATGCLVGMDIGSQLQITNSFPFPASNPDTTGATSSHPSDPYHQADQAALALAAPRAKSSVAYQNEMIKYLREVNVDAQGVGWYVSCSMGNFVTAGFVENQAFYQRAQDERTVALVFDVSRSSQGSLNLKAYRLSPSFMAAYREGKFTTERYVLQLFTLRSL